jgi:O-antigen/teichoic acid export membrane protein
VLVVNLLLFNAMWLGLVLIGDLFIPVAVVWLVSHVYAQERRSKEVLLLLSISLVGVLVDSVLTLATFFVFKDHILIPVWLIFLWFCFAATVNHSLSFLKRNNWFQVLAGVCAPLSYLAGARFEKVELPYGWIHSYLVLAAVWVALMLLFYAIRNRIFEQEKVKNEAC